MHTHRKTLAAALAALLATGPLAAGMEEQSANGITYISGGIGQDESKALRAAAPRYSLAMTFTASSGEYVSDVNVAVKKVSGQDVFSAVSDGPFLLVKLPPGKYKVSATFAGKTQTRNISLAKGQHQRLAMRWQVPVSVVPPSGPADKETRMPQPPQPAPGEAQPRTQPQPLPGSEQ